jgi:phosphoserine phosphatase
MPSVITLLVDPALPRLSCDIAEQVRCALGRSGAGPQAIEWLAPGIACEIALTAEPRAEIHAAVQQALEGRAIDAVLQPARNRRKTLLVADMESTIIVNEMVVELAALLGIGEQVALITERAMKGQMPFRDALRERAALLGGLEEQALQQCCERIVFMPGALTLVATMRAHGRRSALVSGGFRIFTSYVAKRAGFDWHYGNHLVVRDGVVTGALREPVLGREAKREALHSLCAELRIDCSDSIAVGDGANDIDMVTAAGSGIAFRAKEALRREAAHCIDHCDLTALLYIQGYRREEFVEPLLAAPDHRSAQQLQS